jgi:hypothetical protein
MLHSLQALRAAAHLLLLRCKWYDERIDGCMQLLLLLLTHPPELHFAACLLLCTERAEVGLCRQLLVIHYHAHCLLQRP